MSSPLVHTDSASIGGAIDQATAGYLDAGNSGAAKTLDLTLAATQKVTLTASAPTITVSKGDVKGARRVRIMLVQDATATRLLPTFVPAANYGTTGAPTLSTAAGKIDILEFVLLNNTSLYCVGRALGF